MQPTLRTLIFAIGAFSEISRTRSLSLLGTLKIYKDVKKEWTTTTIVIR